MVAIAFLLHPHLPCPSIPPSPSLPQPSHPSRLVPSLIHPTSLITLAYLISEFLIPHPSIIHSPLIYHTSSPSHLKLSSHSPPSRRTLTPHQSLFFINSSAIFISHLSFISYMSLSSHPAFPHHPTPLISSHILFAILTSHHLPISHHMFLLPSQCHYPPPSPSNTHPIHPPTPSLYLSTRLSLSSSFIQSAFPHPLVLPSLFPTTSLRQPILAQAGAGPQCRGRGVPSGWQLQPRSRCPLRSRVPSATGPLRHGGCYG